MKARSAFWCPAQQQRPEVRGRLLFPPCIRNRLFDAGISNRDVRAFWSGQDFDLQLLPFEGNCDGCFLKARPKLFEIERMRPGTLEWWAAWEARKKERFSPNYSYADVQEATRRQGDLFMGAFDDDPDMDAECGTWCGEAA